LVIYFGAKMALAGQIAVVKRQLQWLLVANRSVTWIEFEDGAAIR
jgi:hypothetical protein